MTFPDRADAGQPVADPNRPTADLPAGPTGRAWRLVDRLVVAAFALGLLVPGVLLAAGVRPIRVENRPLLRPPAFDLDRALDGSLTAEVDAYLADNLPLRGHAVRVRGEVEWLAGGTGTPEVVRGREGWAFFRGEFQPDCRLIASELVAQLSTLAARFDAAGRQLRFLLVPDKRTVYPELVPDLPFPASCADSGHAELHDALGRLAPVTIDAEPLLAAARTAAPNGPALYYGLDSHWTPTGALPAIRALVESLDPAAWSDLDVTRRGTVRRRMELARLMGLRRFERTPGIVIRSGTPLEQVDVPVPVDLANARAIFRVAPVGDRPTIAGRTLIVYDSFFGIYVPLVAPFFADTTWVHVGDLLNHPELGAALGPFDRVVVERVERGLYETDLATALEPLLP